MAYSVIFLIIFFNLLSLTILSGLVFLLVEYKIDKMIDEMNIL